MSEIFHIVLVNDNGDVSVKTVQADYLSHAEIQVHQGTVYGSQILAVSNNINLDEASEIAWHSQNAINAYKNLLALKEEN